MASSYWSASRYGWSSSTGGRARRRESRLAASRRVRVRPLTAIVMIGGGFALWLVGRPNSVQIGASGVIFGYLGYLLVSGIVERSLGSILVALVVLALYGTTLWGLLPGQPGVSFEGHITG